MILTNPSLVSHRILTNPLPLPLAPHTALPLIPPLRLPQVKGTPAAAAKAEGTASTAATPDVNARAQLMAQAVNAKISLVAADAGIGDKLVHNYTHALSGFAVSGPTPKQLQALIDNPDVVAIWPNQFYRPVSDSHMVGCAL